VIAIIFWIIGLLFLRKYKNPFLVTNTKTELQKLLNIKKIIVQYSLSEQKLSGIGASQKTAKFIVHKISQTNEIKTQ